MNIVNMNNDITMTSREIAELTGKGHSDRVKKDIEKMFLELELDAGNYAHTYKDASNRDQIEYILPKDEVLCLISGYNVKLRMAIIKRLDELEKQNKPSVPLTYKDALLALIAKEEALEEAIKIKSYISDKKTATALNKASQMSKKANKLEIELDKSKEYATTKRVEKVTGKKYYWKKLKDFSKENNLDIIKVFDSNYGEINSYHADAWFGVYDIDIYELV